MEIFHQHFSNVKMEYFHLLFFCLIILNSGTLFSENYIIKFSKVTNSFDEHFEENVIRKISKYSNLCYEVIFDRYFNQEQILYVLIKSDEQIPPCILDSFKGMEHFTEIWEDNLNKLDFNSDKFTYNKIVNESLLSVFNDTFRKEQWYLDATFGIGLESTYSFLDSLGLTLNKIKIAVLDSGLPEYYFRSDEIQNSCYGGFNFVNGSSILYDKFGHGSHINGIIHSRTNNNLGISGIAKNAMVYNFKIINDNGYFYDSDFIKGMIAAIDSNVKIINLSLGISNTAIANVVNYALSKNIIIVASMGNFGKEILNFPAALEGVFAIGSSNINSERSSFSNYGDYIDFLAPGEDIVSLSKSNPNQIVYMSGTSQSSAIVTGVISIILGIDSSLSRSDIYDILKKGSKPVSGKINTDWDKFSGWGIVDLFGSVKSLIFSRFNSIGQGCNNFRKKFNINYASRDKFYINILENQISSLNIRVFDYIGKELSEEEYNISFADQNVIIDFNKESTGIYFVLIDKLLIILHRY